MRKFPTPKKRLGLGPKGGRFNRKITVLTAYDALTAEMVEKAGVDAILVGDSLGMVLLGYPSTLPVTMDEMIHHAKAVRRGAPKTCVIGDLPYEGIKKGPAQALASAKRFLKEAGCDAVKLEWGSKALETLALLRKNRIPVMGHVGLTPQTAHKTGGYGVRGADAESAFNIYKQALAFEAGGAFSIVLECVPDRVSAKISEKLKIPTVGIGSGSACDGQVLVFHDLVGMFTRFKPKFVKRYADTGVLMQKAVTQYLQETASGAFPSQAESYSIENEPFWAFLAKIKSSK